MPTIPNSTHFYKYRSGEHLERLEQILLRHELYFPTAKELNDPAGCRPRVVLHGVEHELPMNDRAGSQPTIMRENRSMTTVR